MKTVQPIRDLDTLQKCYDIAWAHDAKKGKGEVSWELILLVGFNTSLRVSDFRRFKVNDLRGRDYARITAKKTGKEARILINPSARRQINRLLSGRDGDEYIFRSRQRNGITHKYEPVTRQRCYQIINAIAREAGIEYRIGCHTLRKTFGYHYYRQYKDIGTLMSLFNHSEAGTTLIYIGIASDERKAVARKVDIMYDGDD